MAGLIPFGSHRHGVSRRDGLDDLGFWGDGFMRNFFREAEGFGSFRVDVRDEGDHYEIDAELPGLHREMIDVSMENGVLTISADMNEETKTEKDHYVINERRMGRVSRAFTVNDVKEDEVSAKYQDGVLRVTLPKSGEEEKKSHKIEIQ